MYPRRKSWACPSPAPSTRMTSQGGPASTMTAGDTPGSRRRVLHQEEQGPCIRRPREISSPNPPGWMSASAEATSAARIVRANRVHLREELCLCGTTPLLYPDEGAVAPCNPSAGLTRRYAAWRGPSAAARPGGGPIPPTTTVVGFLGGSCECHGEGAARAAVRPDRR